MDGIILVDKPAGLSSHKVANDVRRALGVKKAGHAGTLDPFATGLLIVLVGRARRVQRFFMGMSKDYEAVARFGAVSTTGDPEGEITATGTHAPQHLDLVSGRISQTPPIYSALKVDGKRAYERARAGEQFEIPAREVEIFEFRELGREDDRVRLKISCSSGTYVRSLVANLGDAYTEELRRTRIGPFSVEDCDAGAVVGMEHALGFFSSVLLGDEDGRKASHGVAVEAPPEAQKPRLSSVNDVVPAEVLLLDGAGPVALAERRDDGMLKPVVGFRE
ncbi:MAG: tRNA pseudouridine(55) synthase TruB [Actinobacteria bacterium]|uniref:tRNA pseudouridine(55) synthase n=1 Tax=freshwater metagenome TaxID=449393 RepID=A0A6J5Z3W0_9ZZZZ|nr:tRNA pseudouridine(55) synthase TruB [Actinomycetota bacterium]